MEDNWGINLTVLRWFMTDLIQALKALSTRKGSSQGIMRVTGSSSVCDVASRRRLLCPTLSQGSS